MSDDTIDKEFDKTVTTLATLSAEWFEVHRDTEITLRFSLYVDESRTGHLQHYYARILDGSMECLIGVLPLLVSRLCSEIGSVAHIPSFKLRPLLSMIIYWLILHHAGKVNGLPGRTERNSIINGLLGK